MKWTYHHKSPAGGKVYYKDNSIMIVYSSKIIVFRNIPENNFVPAMAEYSIERKLK